MIYNELMNTATELADYLLEEPVQNDLVFVTVDKSADMFGHLSCGIFRLHDGFIASGEVSDGVFIIKSDIMVDWYWKRVAKGVPKVYTTGVITIPIAGTYTINHAADPDIKRYPQVKRFVVNAESETLTASDISTIAGVGTPFRKYPFDYIHNYPAVSLAKTYRQIFDQQISFPASTNPYINYHRLHKDGNLHVSSELNESHSYTENAGVWSLDVIHNEDTAGWFSFTHDGEYGARTRYFNPVPGYWYEAYIYKLQSPGVWALHEIITSDVKEYSDDGDNSWSSGLGGGTFLSNGRFVTTRDWPKYSYGTDPTWDYVVSKGYRPTLGQMCHWLPPNYAHNSYVGGYYGVSGPAALGTFYDWLYAPGSILMQHYSVINEGSYFVWTGLSVRLYADDGEYDTVTKDNYISGDQWNTIQTFVGTHDYSKVITFHSEENSICQFSKDGNGFATRLATPANFTMNYKSLVSGKSYPDIEIPSNYADRHFGMGGISNAGFFIKNNTLCKEYNLHIDNVCAAEDFEDPGGLRDYVSSGWKNSFSSLINDQWFMAQAGKDGGVICHIEEADLFTDAVFTFTAPLTAPTGITSATVVGSVPTDTALLFLVQDQANDLYRWNGANWVVTTDLYQGNTIAEFEGAAWPQLVADIGTLANLDFVVMLVSETGSVTPTFTSIEISYTKGTDYEYASLFTERDTGTVIITVVSDTQTKIENSSGAILSNIEVNLFIME